MAAQWTIYDIAREAGVSAKTVSRVLNHKSGVAAETRERVMEIIRRVGFHPHLGARTLRNRKAGCIGVTLPAPPNTVPLSQGFFLWLFAKLFDTFGRRGEYIGFDLHPGERPPGTDYARGVWEQLFKACILAGPLRVDDTVAARVHATGLPYLAFGRLDSLPECSHATVDYEEGTYRSARFLLDRGHTRIAMLRAFDGFQPGEERLRGYRRALDEAGLPFDPALIRSVDFGARGVASAVHRLLDDSSVTALIECSATEDAESLRTGARRAGRVPGQDFEIVAWTYAEDAAVLHEAGAHLWLPVMEAAAEGIDQLARWMDGEREGPIQVLFHPVLRTGAAAGEVPRPRRLFETLD
jgi:LacI family transcriptional regulator